MGDVMLYGVLRMPFDMAMGGEIARRQFYSRAQEAACRLEVAEARLAEIDAALASRPAEVDPAHLLREVLAVAVKLRTDIDKALERTGGAR